MTGKVRYFFPHIQLFHILYYLNMFSFLFISHFLRNFVPEMLQDTKRVADNT